MSNDIGFEPGTDLDMDANDLVVPTTTTYSKWVKDGSWYGAHGRKDYFEHSYLMSGLAGEAGEAADEFKKIQRQMEFLSIPGDVQNCAVSGYDPRKYDIELATRLVKLVDEVGDVVWYVAALCNLWGIRVEDLMLFNMAKLHMKHRENTKMPPWPDDLPTPQEIRVKVILQISETLGHDTIGKQKG